jgi:hypothetical protein
VSVEALAVDSPLLEVAPGVNAVSLLLLVSPVGKLAVALLLLPAPVLSTKELEPLELLLTPLLSELSTDEDELKLLEPLLTPLLSELSTDEDELELLEPLLTPLLPELSTDEDELKLLKLSAIEGKVKGNSVNSDIAANLLKRLCISRNSSSANSTYSCGL